MVLFFLAMGYANNLIYIFVFLLISMTITGMVITNFNVDAAEIEIVPPNPLFAEEVGTVMVNLANRRNHPLWDFEILFRQENEFKHEEQIAEKDKVQVEVPFYPSRRGRHRLPTLIVQSSFPFGLMRAWKSVKEVPDILIYPARKGQKSFPTGSFGNESPQSTGIFRDHRLFQTTDSTMRVDWRASARRPELLVKNFEEGDKPLLHFHWDQTEHIKDSELRLSQLCLWIDEAERAGHAYSLEIAGHKISFSRGSRHWHQCLEILATVKLETLA